MSDPDRSLGSHSLMSVPDPREFVSSLLAAIPPAPSALLPSSNIVRDIPHAKQIFLALHVLFPNEVLPALDVLDRNLVVRLRGPPHLPGLESSDTARARTLLFVRSTRQQQQQQQQNRRHSAAQHYVPHYEVQLDAWNCSCPAFAFAALPAATRAEDDVRRSLPSIDGYPALPSDGDVQIMLSGTSDFQRFHFGGLSRGGDLPVCKHLLACVLVEHCAAFTHCVDDRDVSEAEMAGWAAGYGD